MVFSFLLHFPIFPIKTGFFRFFCGFPFDLGKFDLGIPHIPDIPHIPEIFDLGISSQTGFFLGGVFGTFFWVGFLAQHGPEPPSPILLSYDSDGFRNTIRVITFCVITLCVRKVITFCVEKFLHFALNTLLHVASMLLHFAAIVITFCVSITFCGDCYYILR